MEEQRVLRFCDLRWFETLILSKPPSDIDGDPVSKREASEQVEASAPPETGDGRSLHRRSLSDQLQSERDTFSPISVLEVPKLETILSGKEAAAPSKEVASTEAHRRTTGRKTRGSKSLSDLEFEELKGFMDLGFTFPEGEMDPELISILPGLAVKKDGSREIPGKSQVRRPYLSEAWGVSRKDYKPIGNHRKLPAGGGDADMKDLLRHWAHAVASTVR